MREQITEARAEQIIDKRVTTKVVMQELTDACPVGSEVATTVHTIGGRSERVTGTVVDYRRRSVVVATECHGRIVVPLDKIES